jgi:hypothetical protein
MLDQHAASPFVKANTLREITVLDATQPARISPKFKGAAIFLAAPYEWIETDC